MVVAEFIGRWNIRFSRGTRYTGILLGIVSLATLVKVYQSSFEYIGIPYIVAGTVAVLGFLFVNLLSGFIDEKLGTWSAESSHANMNMNPEFREVVEWVRTQKVIKE